MANFFDEIDKKVQKYKIKHYNKPVIACLSFLIFFASNLLKFLISGKLKRKKRISNKLKIGFYLWGGIGDALINLNYLYYFKNYIKNENVLLDVYFEKPSFTKFVKEGQFIDNIYVGDDYCIDDYDVFISLLIFPRILKFNKNNVLKISEKLHNLLIEYEKFNNDNYRVISAEPYLYPVEERLSVINNQKRIQQPDICDTFKISENYILPLEIGNIDETLDKFGLLNRRFITLNRGVGAKSTSHPKLWETDKYNELIKLLKEKYPEVILVQIGSADQTLELMDNIDINLVGKTDIEELKIILKTATLHIDCEGGLVHLRKALNGGSSVVLFGPTSLEFFGYSTNINIKANNACKLDCQWVNSNWESRCIKTNSDMNPCMQLIEPSDVFNEIIRKFNEVLN